jgi:hypothetical protein
VIKRLPATRRPRSKTTLAPTSPARISAGDAVAKAFASNQGEPRWVTRRQPTIAVTKYRESSQACLSQAHARPASAEIATTAISKYVTSIWDGRRRKSPTGQMPKTWSELNGSIKFPRSALLVRLPAAGRRKVSAVISDGMASTAAKIENATAARAAGLQPRR